MDPIAILVMGLAFTTAGFFMGRAVTKWPDENEMFERIVRLRHGRLLNANVRKDLETELQHDAERRLRS